MNILNGCSDGNCVIRRPVGQHTNGGCQCLKMLRYPEGQTEFRDQMALVRAVVEAAVSFWKSDKGDRKREMTLFNAVEAFERETS